MIDREYSRTYLPAQDTPNDIEGKISALRKVVRYNVPYYPANIFASQTVNLHTRRLVSIWRHEKMPRIGERSLWVHDIPEIMIGDLLVVETVDNPTLQDGKDLEEHNAARDLLTESDCKLLELFNAAGLFWKGKTHEYDYLAAAAKMIDIVDGNVIFHEVISKYCLENGCDDLDLRINPSFHYAFDQSIATRSQLEHIGDTQRDWFVHMIDLQFAYINYYWQGVPQSLIPTALQEELSAQ